ncbi:uncharacterized protein LOC134659456 [Cydia amplana]|uniref:uncharacterized protein LOC134659456 n=1 Tax=Cydia amplana TaxID=1869771 RepID=UPI002FE56C4E
MDLKTFGEDDFDPKKWINRAWSSSGNQEKEVFVANTVSRLQLYMKQLTNSLDETTTQIVNSIPRTLQDAAALQLDGALLQQRLLSLEGKVESVEEQTGHSILSLQRIDQLKSRLENAASALREADKWAALATALEDVLESGVPNKPEELEALAGQVTALTHSLEVLTEASDYESKRLQLEALYNRLEAALSAPFLTALEQGDKDYESKRLQLEALYNRLEAALSAPFLTALEQGDKDYESKRLQLEALYNRLEAALSAPFLTALEQGDKDYESKRLQLEALYNRLEAALSAPFLTALEQGDKERTACYVSLFRGMNRASSAARCWRRSVCTSLATQWRRSAGQPAPRVAALAGKGEAHTHVRYYLCLRVISDAMAPVGGAAGATRRRARGEGRGTHASTQWRRSAGQPAPRVAALAGKGEAHTHVRYYLCLRVISDAMAPVGGAAGATRRRARGEGRGTHAYTISVCTSLATQWRRSAGQPSPRVAALAGKGEAHTHVEWLTNVLKSETPYAELVRLYTDLLQSLDPSPAKVVSARLKLCSDPEEGILLLIELRRDIDEFLASIRAVIDEPAKNKEVVPPSTLQELGVAAYAPLKDLLPKYTDLQRQVFLAYLEGPQLRQDDILEQSRAILTVSERCEGWLDTAYGKAKKIASDAAWPHYAPTVEAFFTAVCALISSHSRRIEQEFQTSRGGVLSAACPAAVTLERAAAQALEAAGTLPTCDTEQPSHPLTDLPSLLLDADGRCKLPGARAEPPASVSALRRAARQLRALARAIVRGPVDAQLDKIPSLNVWSNNDALSTDLPDFSLSPQEYITEIGQYLMTLPQHLEMHLSEKQAPWQFLSEICTHTCEVYAEKILNIRNMDALGTKRCLTDIVYLSSVVEDLGTAVTPSLKNLERSLRVATPQHE